VSNFNRVIILGNLTRDPEHKQLSSGASVTRLGIASNHQYKNRQTGAAVQEVCFIDVDVFGPQADSCRQYLQKGRSVLIEGRLKFSSWQGQDGQTKSKHSIIADRVYFLQAGATASQEDSLAEFLSEGAGMQDVASNVKAAVRSVKKPTEKREGNLQDPMEALSFKDEPPFQDDLPF